MVKNDPALFEELIGKKVLVTGATGLIGQALVKKLVLCGAEVVAVIRNEEKARRIFQNTERISFLVSEITALAVSHMGIDYVIHTAASTSSKSFVQDPVGIAFTSLEGTKRTLELARKNSAKAYVYLSSMEIYGPLADDTKVNELHASALDTMKARSSYAESKRMCESLCAAYCAQYKVPAKVVRLTQTFGEGVRYDDERVFAEFARCAIEGRDIVLHTKGETKRSYLYVQDAVNAILTVLLRGAEGEAYNAANESTYCSILEMAQMVARLFGGGKVQVVFDTPEDVAGLGYAPILHINLDSQKLRNLGWHPSVGLEEMFERLIQAMIVDQEIVHAKFYGKQT